MPNINRESNPELYRKLNVPFPSVAASNVALAAFNEGLRRLRIKHGIADLYCIAMTRSIHNGKDGRFMSSMQFGDELNAEFVTAWAFGFENDRHQRLLESVVIQGAETSERLEDEDGKTTDTGSEVTPVLAVADAQPAPGREAEASGAQPAPNADEKVFSRGREEGFRAD